MSNYTLKPLSALGGTTPKVDQFDGLTIREDMRHNLASLAMRKGQDAAFHQAAQTTFMAALPEPGCLASGDVYRVFWAAPEQWLVGTGGEHNEDIATDLKAKFGESASVTEQSGGWVKFDLNGDRCIDVLERICALNCRNMADNQASRSVIEHIGVFVLCLKSGQHFSIYGPSSSANSLHHALVAAAQSAM